MIHPVLLGIYVSNEESIKVDSFKLKIRGTDFHGSRYLELRQNMLVVHIASAWVEYQRLIGETQSGDRVLE